MKIETKIECGRITEISDKLMASNKKRTYLTGKKTLSLN
jgi:hypothetical protein